MVQMMLDRYSDRRRFDPMLGTGRFVGKAIRVGGFIRRILGGSVRSAVIENGSARNFHRDLLLMR